MQWSILVLLAIFLHGSAQASTADTCDGQSCSKKKTMDEHLAEIRAGSDTCDQLEPRALKALTAGNADLAASLLIVCAERAPNKPRVANVGQFLAKINRKRDALPWLMLALRFDPRDTTLLETAASAALSENMNEEAIQLYEQLAEIRLGVKEGLLLSTLVKTQRYSVNELTFININDETIQTLRLLLHACLKSYKLPHSDLLYSFVAKLTPQDGQLVSNFGVFSFSIGKVLQGAQVTETELMKSQAKPSKSLLTVTAHFDAYITTTTRNFLMPISEETLFAVGNNCNYDLMHLFNATTVPSSASARFFAKCCVEQELAAYFVNRGANINEENPFGFTSLFHAAFLGDADLVNSMLELNANAHHRNWLGQTFLHRAVMRGAFDVVNAALQIPGLLQIRDIFGRTALDIACRHSSWYFASSESQSSSQFSLAACSQQQQYPKYNEGRPGAHQISSSGWHSSSTKASTCDFDVRENINAQEFLREYLSIDRPVLIRGAMIGRKWDQLRKRWQRDSFRTLYGSEIHRNVSIPYAESFGIPDSPTRVDDFLDYMATLRNVMPDPSFPPNYIFETLRDTSPLEHDIVHPDFIDRKVSKMNTLAAQFYVGPVGSGAPMHFHSAAINVLVHGRKQWYITPSHYAVYSVKHPLAWVDQELPNLGLHEMSCVQDSGDIIFVPETWGHATVNLDESIGYALEGLMGSSDVQLNF